MRRALLMEQAMRQEWAARQERLVQEQQQQQVSHGDTYTGGGWGLSGSRGSICRLASSQQDACTMHSTTCLQLLLLLGRCTA